jgi:hypothetical protein
MRKVLIMAAAGAVAACSSPMSSAQASESQAVDSALDSRSYDVRGFERVRPSGRTAW